MVRKHREKAISKIAWNTVCLPKEEGGLGLRNLAVWNQVLCLKFIWLLVSKSPSLWVEWHWSINILNKSIWSIEASVSDSWAWRKILALRPLALQFCKLKLGDGLSASFWYDSWTPFGQLISHFGEAGPRVLRVCKDAVVADAIRDDHWSLPHPRSEKEVDLHSYLTTIVLPLSLEFSDTYDWIAGDHSFCGFRSDTTWEEMRPREGRKDWIDVVWFKGAIPKLAFTMWVANYNRLPTRSRLVAWGMQVSPNCPFCSSHEETRDHLFLSCDYSKEIWREVMLRCRPPSRMCTTWSELLSWIRSSTSKRLTLLRKLAVQTVIFHIWKQRNLIHNQTSLPAATVLYGIDKELRNIISARRTRNIFKPLMSMWLS